MVQFAWLIELPRDTGRTTWWDGRDVDTFTSDANDAVRFARREDAERVASWLVRRDHQPRAGLGRVIVLEHGWDDSPNRAVSKDRFLDP